MDFDVIYQQFSTPLQKDRRKDKDKQKKRKESDLPGLIAGQSK